MKIQPRRFLSGLTALFVTSALVVPALAHDAPCPYCEMAITQDTPAQDNEVALKIGRKRVEYKCVYCALSEAKTEYQGDLSILAPSEKKGEPIKLMRTGGKWSASSETLAFVTNAPLKHKECQAQARAFTTPEAAQAYIAAHKDELSDARPLTMTEMLALVDASNK